MILEATLGGISAILMVLLTLTALKLQATLQENSEIWRNNWEFGQKQSSDKAGERGDLILVRREFWEKLTLRSLHLDDAIPEHSTVGIRSDEELAQEARLAWQELISAPSLIDPIQRELEETELMLVRNQQREIAQTEEQYEEEHQKEQLKELDRLDEIMGSSEKPYDGQQEN